MSATPLELAVPTTAPAPGARSSASSGASTGTDAQSGKDFAALVAQALGLAHPGAEQSPTAPGTTTGPAPQAGDGDTTPKAGTPAPAQQGADTTAPDPATDAPVLTDQAARDAVVAALGLVPVTVPVTVPTSGSASAPDPVTATASATASATAAVMGPGPGLRPASSATPVDATSDPKSTSKTAATTDTTTDTKAAATTPAAAQTPAATPDVAGTPLGAPGATATATAAAALAAATTGAGLQDGAKSRHQDGQGGKQDADTAVTPTATPGAGTTTAPADTPAAAVTATTGDTVQVVAAGPVVVTTAVQAAQAAQAAPGRTHGVHHVATQVIPEITRLVSDGEGVHRVTLQLNPRALGDVRVVLTMRQGDVHVRLVAGDDARAALASSSSELTRALDQLGLKDHRISLSSLSDPSGTTWSSGSDQTNDPRQHAQHPGGLDADLQDQKNAQHLWMGDDSTATDGMTPSNPAGRTSRSVPVPTFGATPAGALDVRM